MKKEITTIKISKNTASILGRLKIHPRQPYEEVILKFIQEHRDSKNNSGAINFSGRLSVPKKDITTIKLSKKTAEALGRLKIHPRQPYEEVILNLISENEENKKKSR